MKRTSTATLVVPTGRTEVIPTDSAILTDHMAPTEVKLLRRVPNTVRSAEKSIRIPEDRYVSTVWRKVKF